MSVNAIGSEKSDFIILHKLDGRAGMSLDSNLDHGLCHRRIFCIGTDSRHLSPPHFCIQCYLDMVGGLKCPDQQPTKENEVGPRLLDSELQYF